MYTEQTQRAELALIYGDGSPVGGLRTGYRLVGAQPAPRCELEDPKGGKSPSSSNLVPCIYLSDKSLGYLESARRSPRSPQPAWRRSLRRNRIGCFPTCLRMREL